MTRNNNDSIQPSNNNNNNNNNNEDRWNVKHRNPQKCNFHSENDTSSSGDPTNASSDIMTHSNSFFGTSSNGRRRPFQHHLEMSTRKYRLSSSRTTTTTTTGPRHNTFQRFTRSWPRSATPPFLLMCSIIISMTFLIGLTPPPEFTSSSSSSSSWQNGNSGGSGSGSGGGVTDPHGLFLSSPQLHSAGTLRHTIDNLRSNNNKNNPNVPKHITRRRITKTVKYDNETTTSSTTIQGLRNIPIRLGQLQKRNAAANTLTSVNGGRLYHQSSSTYKYVLNKEDNDERTSIPIQQQFQVVFPWILSSTYHQLNPSSYGRSYVVHFPMEEMESSKHHDYGPDFGGLEHISRKNNPINASIQNIAATTYATTTNISTTTSTSTARVVIAVSETTTTTTETNDSNNVPEAQERQIAENDELSYEKLRNHFIKDAPNGDYGCDTNNNDPSYDEIRSCHRTNWRHLQFPTCNTIHELSLDRPPPRLMEKSSSSSQQQRRNEQDYDINFISQGSFRLTFKMNRPDIKGDAFVLKPLIFKESFNSFVKRQLYSIPTEVLILERLTSSPRITDVYGHCGATTMLELLPNEINEQIQPGRGRANQTELDIWQVDDVHSKNNLTNQRKVDIALEMAEAIAEIHGFSDGVIIHGDNHIDQFLVSASGQLKFNDFNLATILEWNEAEHDYCPREREPWRYAFRAPEEIGGRPFNEQIDVFSFGNSIYSLITGLRPFYDIVRAKEVCTKIENGERAYIDPRYRQRSYQERRLIEIMEQCWEHDPEIRPTIFTVVQRLRDLQQQQTQLQSQPPKQEQQQQEEEEEETSPSIPSRQQRRRRHSEIFVVQSEEG